MKCQSIIRKMDRVYKNIRLVCDGFFCKEKRKELLSIEEQCVVVRYSENVMHAQNAINNGFQITGMLLRRTTNILKVLFPLKSEKVLRISKNLLFYSWFSEKKKWCIIYIMIRRISFSLFLIYEFHLIIYLFSLISWFKREQVIHIECFFMHYKK